MMNSRFVSNANYGKNSSVSRSDWLASWGMGLIIVGIIIFLMRDLRGRFEQFERFFDDLENRFWYVPFVAPASALLGLFLVMLALVL